MKVEIRRNQSLNFNLRMADDNIQALRKLIGSFPKLTPEQQELLNERDRQRHEIEEKIWADIESKKPVYDLLGNPISRETHEICYDMYSYTDDKGNQWMAAKAIYIQPKKSEYDKDGKFPSNFP
jgi:hypothetical protein